jgi:hypothetical protein
MNSLEIVANFLKEVKEFYKLDMDISQSVAGYEFTLTENIKIKVLSWSDQMGISIIYYGIDTFVGNINFKDLTIETFHKKITQFFVHRTRIERDTYIRDTKLLEEINAFNEWEVL